MGVGAGMTTVSNLLLLFVVVLISVLVLPYIGIEMPQ